MFIPAAYAVLVSFLAVRAHAQTWCGKNYMASSPIAPPGGQFSIPATSPSPLVAFRCAPAIRPYLPEDVNCLTSFIIDTLVTNSEVAGAQAIILPNHGPLGNLEVSISVNGRMVANGAVPLNASKVEIPFSLHGLNPQTAAFEAVCTASYAGGKGKSQTLRSTTSLSFLPDPPAGRSVTKMDLRTGALLAKPATGEQGPYAPILPIGFYTDFGGYLASNLSLLDDLKAQGFTVVHPVPTFDNLTAFDAVVDRMQELGLYLMYDMRWSYTNSTAVSMEVTRVMNRPNLLLWYTGDEPDGTSDPLTATSSAYDLIYSLDGYHPVSLVLNCENFYFTEYSSGADIVMQDTYMIGNNVTFSSQWGTVCTPDYGDCGCDNCKGEFEDITTRMDEFAQRLWVNGWDRTKAVWAVPQAFGDDTYWKRVPTGQEYVVQAVLGINHGARGVVAWNDPTTPDIKSAASSLAKLLPAMAEFVLNPAATFEHVVSDRIDVGMWTVGRNTLLLATNLNYAQVSFSLDSVHAGTQVQQIFDSGVTTSGRNLVFEPVGSGAFVFSSILF